MRDILEMRGCQRYNIGAFSDISSRYHSLTSPLIWRDFLLPLLAVSALSTRLTKRILQRGNSPLMYFSTSSNSRVNRD